MKKKLAALLALAAFAGASAIAIGCEDGTPSKKPPAKPSHTEHTLVWDSDGTQHWQYCDTDGCGYVGEKTDHTWAWDNDGTQHWQYCDTDGCGYIGEKTDHTWAWDKDDTQHWQYCDTEGCDYVGTKNDHDWHWGSDDAEHWQFCNNNDCGYIGEKHPHVDDLDGDEDGKDAICDECGKELTAEEHQHTLVWKTSDTHHWQACSVLGCTEVGEKHPHVDDKNNETEAETPDGLCDDCGKKMIRTVTFDGNGHDVTLPAAQKVEHGDCATNPGALGRDGDYEFVGWGIKALINDEEQVVAYSFETPITADTVLYARWEAIEGTKTKPFTLALGTQKLTPLQKGEKAYYTFTAAEADRFVISLANGASSQKCRFTTDLDEEDVWYGNGCDNATKIVELQRGDSVTIELTCLNDLDEDARVSVLVNEVSNEPLPDDKYLAGLYADDNGVFQIEIDRDKEVIKFNNNSYGYRYVGGSIDLMRFTISLGASTTNYNIKYESEGVYTLSWGARSDQSTMLKYINLDDLIDVSAFAGIYKPATDADKFTFGDSSSRSTVDVIAIDVNGNGYYELNGSSSSSRVFGAGTTFDKVAGTLSYGMFTISVNLDENGDTVSINVTMLDSRTGDVTKIYKRVGNAPAEIMENLPLEDGTYKGETYTIRKQAYATYWGDEGTDVVDVDGYDGSEFYSISVYKNKTRTVYKLKLLDDGVIKLYDNSDGEGGPQLLDTLKRPELAQLPPLVVSEELQVVNTADFDKNFYLYEVQEAGLYKFSTPTYGLTVYINVNPENPASAYVYSDPIEFDAPLNLAAGCVVGLYIGGIDEPPATVAFNVVKTELPAGYSEDDPLIVNGSAVLNMDGTGTQYYFRYTAPRAGDYIISFSFKTSWGSTSHQVYFTIGDNAYGTAYEYVDYGGWGWEDFVWKGGLSEEDPYLRRSFEVGETILIVASRAGHFYEADVTLIIAPDYSDVATEIDMTETTLVAGIYVYSGGFDDPDAIGLQLSSDTEFTVVINGIEQTVKSVVLTSAQLKLGFELVDGPVNIALAYQLGTEKAPLPASIDDVNEDNLISVPTFEDSTSWWQTAYVTITAGDKALVLTIPDLITNSYDGEITTKFYFTVKDEDGQYTDENTYGYKGTYDSSTDSTKYEPYANGPSLTIAAGQTVVIKLGATDYGFMEDHIDIMLVEADA